MTTPTAPVPAAAAITKAAPWKSLAKGLPQIRACLDEMKAQIALALPKHLTPERMLRVAMTALQADSKLLDCDTLSVVGGVVAAAQLGLEIGGALGQAYLIPYDGVATFIPGYRGMIDLARRSGEVSVIEAVVVHKRDKFLIQQGTDAKIDHKPYIGDGNPGPAIGVYAVCKMRDGTTQFAFMRKDEIESIRKQSKGAASKYSPWNSPHATVVEEMWKKSALRRLWKVLPVSVERAMAKAIVAQDRAEAGTPIDASAMFSGADIFGDAIDGEFEKREPEPTRTATTAETPTRRTRRTAEPDAAPADPTAELVALHERVHKEDPEAFAFAWDIPNEQAPTFQIAKRSVDELTIARDRGVEWARENPLPSKVPAK